MLKFSAQSEQLSLLGLKGLDGRVHLVVPGHWSDSLPKTGFFGVIL
jgi:hypothetical protein